MTRVLVTGGLGFIGSHVTVDLLLSGYSVVVLDNLSNSSRKTLERISVISDGDVELVIGDIRDKSVLKNIFSTFIINAVIHLAGYKSVSESKNIPLEYYDNNVFGTINLLQTMHDFEVNKIIFSSSATIYGDVICEGLEEDTNPGRLTNPYAVSKSMVEQVLKDYCNAKTDFTAISLRYFNPIGAHPTGLLGENPKGIPNNLFPYILQVSSRKLEKLYIYGNDYLTTDGTGVRDYIHVNDLSAGHVVSLKINSPGFEAFNLGTGIGTSVLQLINIFSEVNNVNIPFSFTTRRPGDLATVYAKVDKAETILGWKAKFSLQEMCKDGWLWEQMRTNKLTNNDL